MHKCNLHVAPARPCGRCKLSIGLLHPRRVVRESDLLIADFPWYGLPLRVIGASLVLIDHLIVGFHPERVEFLLI
jgi:hypothetical protein